MFNLHNVLQVDIGRNTQIDVSNMSICLCSISIGVFTYREHLHQIGGLCGQALLLLDVVPHVAKLLLQHAHRLKVRRMVEGVASEEQELTAGKGRDQSPQGSVARLCCHCVSPL